MFSKKFATLMFAIGLGAASSVFAGPGDPPTCEQSCFTTYRECIAADPAWEGWDCEDYRMTCMANCGV